MKKILASTGLAALGAASMQAAYAPGLTAVQTSKPWSVSAAVRGFYDDNWNTRPTHSALGTTKQSSWGVDVNPSVGLNLLPDEQTYLSVSYTYDLYYYADRKGDDADHQHQAQIRLGHQFSEHYKADVSDTFVVSREPALSTTVGVVTLPLRTQLSYLMNAGNAKFDADLTDRLSTEIGYSNTLYSYDQRGPGSLSALLDRMEHLASVALRWNVQPSTTAVLGYQFGYTDMTSHDPLLDPATGVFYPAKVRNARSHYGFVGVDQNFNPQLNGSVRVGVEYTEYPDKDRIPAGTSFEGNQTSPYADASLTYTYNPGSYVQVGAKHQRNATYVGFLGPGKLLLDSESTMAYAMVNHKITGKLTGNLMGTYQNSVYHVPGVPDKEDNYVNITATLDYQINEFLTAEANYAFYRLDSDLPDTSFTRNIVFFGVRAAY